MTIKELEENLEEGRATSVGSSGKNLARAKVVGIACDVCEPDDVRKLADFAIGELGSIDIWVSDLPILLIFIIQSWIFGFSRLAMLGVIGNVSTKGKNKYQQAGNYNNEILFSTLVGSENFNSSKFQPRKSIFKTFYF